MGTSRLGQTRHTATTSEYGILGVRSADFRLDRVPASTDLADLVERHWLVSWRLPAGRRGSVTLLPHPCVNLVFDRGEVAIAGVGRECFTYEYEGEDRVFGVKFRPGGFPPFLGGPVSHLTDRSFPLATVWGGADSRRFAMETEVEPITAGPARPAGAWSARARVLTSHSAVRYMIIGVVSAGADFGLLYVLHGWLGVVVPVAAFLAVAISFVLNFTLNRIWSFRSTAPVSGQFTRYLLLACVNWVLTAILVTLFTRLGLFYLIAKMITLVLTTASNYLLYRVWVFADRQRRA